MSPKRTSSKRHSPSRSSSQLPSRQNKAAKRQSNETIKLKATVDKNRKGFAFLIFEKKEYEDAFVPPGEAESLFQGDRVEATLNSRGRLQGIKVLEHRFREIVGRYTPHPKRKGEGWVVYEKKRAREEIYIPQSPRKPKEGDWVRAKLRFHEKGPYAVTGDILDIYGQDLPASADVAMVAAEYNLSEEHSAAAEQEAKLQKLDLGDKVLKDRKDLRNVPFITIDGETARDFDDAVFVERVKSGYVLWVAIADVSHYVKDGSPLDIDAKAKGTSVYFPERAFHMLPRVLSENLCSLRPNEPRLTLVAKMEFDRDAKRLRTEVMEAIIESKRRATYTEIQSESELHKNDPKWEFSPHFELYRALRKMRTARGSIDFELPEAEVVVEPSGEVVSIKNRPRLDTHRLIEEFMIAANESVTEWMMERKWPFVYRIHEQPSMDSLEKFQSLAATVGVKISLDSSIAPKVMADLVRQLEGHPAQSLLNMALLRSMKQATYSSTHGNHYGLASQAYTHFTSPIRRYPDLVVHRLIRMVLRKGSAIQPFKAGPQPLQSGPAKGKIVKAGPRGKPVKGGSPTKIGPVKVGPGSPAKEGPREKLEQELALICEHCSYRERLAADAERDSIKIKQVRAIFKHLGDEFDAQVVGMIAAGLFVRIDNPFVEGMVSSESMVDDLYEFNEERMVFYGRKKKRTFKIGDRLKVKAVRADIDRRQIDFTMIE